MMQQVAEQYESNTITATDLYKTRDKLLEECGLKKAGRRAIKGKSLDGEDGPPSKAAAPPSAPAAPPPAAKALGAKTKAVGAPPPAAKARGAKAQGAKAQAAKAQAAKAPPPAAKAPADPLGSAVTAPVGGDLAEAAAVGGALAVPRKRGVDLASAPEAHVHGEADNKRVKFAEGTSFDAKDKPVSKFADTVNAEQHVAKIPPPQVAPVLAVEIESKHFA